MSIIAERATATECLQSGTGNLQTDACGPVSDGALECRSVNFRGRSHRRGSAAGGTRFVVYLGAQGGDEGGLFAKGGGGLEHGCAGCGVMT
ncbi:hypothetical protein WBP06_10415 [Novosphingobium sp. BL-8H]|uniref:hypothetical protein n=1 Tax=Novosphingobium sp. BL-8H TaxID=3127640 RepID=UPI0037568DF3